jgi:hypothetical protein
LQLGSAKATNASDVSRKTKTSRLADSILLVMA